MKINGFSFWIIFILLISASGCSDDVEMIQDPIEPTLQERLQEIMDSKVGPGQLKGAVVSIRKDGMEKWQVVGGISDANTQMTRDMRFGIASITKTAVAATILKLEEEGLLTLDDTIDDWLDLDSKNVNGAITIFQLLNHLTGVKGYFQHPNIWPLVEANLDTPIAPEDLVQFIGLPVFEPGERYAYSNSNYLLLGLIIRSVTGQTVGEVMRSRFWDPLKMNDIYFGSDESPTGSIAAPWRDGNGDGTLEDISGEFRAAYHSIFFTAADIFSTASDLSMWASHLYGGSALGAASKEKMLDFLFVDSGDQYWDGYGLGVRRIYIAGREMWGHTGGMRGYGSFMLYEPNSKVSIAMLNNQSRSEHGPVLRLQLVEEILAEVFNEN